ncbi:ATP-grasp domain-containing protein [Vibrio vulnificus]|nr:ATP-grasp domain-containing protein [Vibrio vulnificus]
MKYLVLTRNPSTVTAYNEWLDDVKQETIVLASTSHQGQYDDFGLSFYFDDYDNNDEVEKVAIDLGRKYPIEAVGIISEIDIIRASKIRNALGLSGQNIESAIAFRQKNIMKDIASANDIACAAYSIVKSERDIANFLESNSFPVVFKPSSGLGSVDTFVVASQSELNEKLDTLNFDDCLVEQFIEGEMLHIDGIVRNGSIAVVSISKYLGSCLDFQVSQPLCSIQLSNESQLYKEALDFTNKIVNAFPFPESSGFHLEVFNTEEGLVFCEIASRIGGAGVNETIVMSHNVNLAHWWLRLQLDLDYSNNVVKSEQLYGWGLIPPQKGEITSLEVQDFDEGVTCRIHTEVGKQYQGAQSSVDSIASFIASASNERLLASKLKSTCKKLHEGVAYKDM